MVFSTLLSHSLWIALHPLGLQGINKTLFSCTGIHHDDRAYMITLEMFTNGFYILGFEITPERDEDHICLPCQGNVRTEAYLKNRHPNPSLAFYMLNFLDT
jgi:hypothetical protein